MGGNKHIKFNSEYLINLNATSRISNNQLKIWRGMTFFRKRCPLKEEVPTYSQLVFLSLTFRVRDFKTEIQERINEHEERIEKITEDVKSGKKLKSNPYMF